VQWDIFASALEHEQVSYVCAHAEIGNWPVVGLKFADDSGISIDYTVRCSEFWRSLSVEARKYAVTASFTDAD
jgi:hypothetical protein